MVSEVHLHLSVILLSSYFRCILHLSRCLLELNFTRADLFAFSEDFLVSEMTYTVSSGTLNSSIPYHLVYGYSDDDRICIRLA